MSPRSDDRLGTRVGAHPDLDHRLQARALVLALQSEVTVSEAADTLVATAGVTPAAPIAVRRALTRLQTANDHRPSRRTAAAVEALRLALARLPARYHGSSEVRPDGVPPSGASRRRYGAR